MFTQTVANSKRATIDSFFISKENLLNAYAEDFALIKEKDEKELRELLKSLNRADAAFTGSYIGFPDKKFIIEPKEDMPDGYDCTSRPWYKKAVENPGTVVITDPYINASEDKALIITMARQVTLLDGTKAVVGADIRLTGLSKILTQDNIGENGYVYILSQQGQILAHKNEKLAGEDVSKEQFVQEMIKNKEGNMHYTFNGKNFVGGYSTSNQGFIVGVAMPSTDYMKHANKLRILTALIGLLLISIIVISMLIFLKKVILNKLLSIVDATNKLSNGDYTISVAVTSEDEIGDLQRALNNMIQSQKSILSKLGQTKETLLDSSDNIAKISNELGSASTEVANTMQQVAEGASQQAADITEVASIVDDLRKSVDEMNVKLKEVIGLTEVVSNSAKDSQRVVVGLTKSSENVGNVFTNVAETINSLVESVNSISGITNVITEIASQTNLLALNAAIEAARAGEAGRGFAVVADEVRKLAEQSSKSANEIKNVLEQIQVKADKTNENILNATDELTSQLEFVSVASKSFETIIEQVNNIVPTIQGLTGRITELVKLSDTAGDRLQSASAITEENTASAEEVAASAQELNASVEHIIETMKDFRILAKEFEDIMRSFKL